MNPKIRLIGGNNPEITLKHESVRDYWRCDVADRDLYRLSKGGKDEVIVIFAPAFKAGYQITMIYSNWATKTHRVAYKVIEDDSRNEVETTLNEMIDTMLPVTA